MFSSLHFKAYRLDDSVGRLSGCSLWSIWCFVSLMISWYPSFNLTLFVLIDGLGRSLLLLLKTVDALRKAHHDHPLLFYFYFFEFFFSLHVIVFPPVSVLIKPFFSAPGTSNSQEMLKYCQADRLYHLQMYRCTVLRHTYWLSVFQYHPQRCQKNTLVAPLRFCLVSNWLISVLILHTLLSIRRFGVFDVKH